MPAFRFLAHPCAPDSTYEHFVWGALACTPGIPLAPLQGALPHCWRSTSTPCPPLKHSNDTRGHIHPRHRSRPCGALWQWRATARSRRGTGGREPGDDGASSCTPTPDRRPLGTEAGQHRGRPPVRQARRTGEPPRHGAEAGEGTPSRGTGGATRRHHTPTGRPAAQHDGERPQLEAPGPEGVEGTTPTHQQQPGTPSDR